MATLFLVSSFVTVLLSVTALTSNIFVTTGQKYSSDVDIIMTTLTSFDTLVDLNRNPYALDPFAEE